MITMSLRSAARDALQVQDAVNLSGVVRSFAEVLSTALWPAAFELGQGTDWVSTHPISVLFADKIADLTGFIGRYSEDTLTVKRAYASVRTLAAFDEDNEVSQ